MNPDILTTRARVLAAIRRFFEARGYLEVDTPLLAPSLIPESQLEVFRTAYLHPDRPAEDLYLVPSPEVWIKRLLADGAGSLFQLSKAFRNGETIGRLHAPEFTMLEYYTVDAGYIESIEVTEALLRAVAKAAGDTAAGARTAGTGAAVLTAPLERISVAEAFARYGDMDGDAIQNYEGITHLARRQGLRPRGDESYEELFNRLLVQFVEPELPTDRPVVLFDYPAAIPTLAADSPGTPWSERWELYLAGLEVANCYTEERDPQKVRSFMAAEGARKARGLVPHRVDESYHAIFGENFPYCSGVAMGADRLLMILLGEQSIKRVMPFSALM